MPIKKLTVDERISDWVYATNDIIDELNNGVGDRTQLITQSKIVVSAINALGGEDFWTETKFQDGAVTNPKINDDAVTTRKLEDNIIFEGTHGKLPSGTTAQRPYQGSSISTVFYNGDANEDFIITGKGFDTTGVQIALIGTDNSEVAITSYTIVSSEIIRFTVPQNLDPNLKPYSVRVTNNNVSGQPDVTSTGVLNFGGGPVWTSSGVILNFYDYETHLNGNVQVELDARDPDQAPLTYALNSGTLPAGGSIFPEGIVNIPECPPQYVQATAPTVFQFTASATDGINPAVNSGTLQLNVNPQNPERLIAGDGMVAWYQAAGFDASNAVWRDDSGNGNDMTIDGAANCYVNTWSLGRHEGVFDASRQFKYVYMPGSSSGFATPFTTGSDWTIFHVTRYAENTNITDGTGGNRGRILDGATSNFLIGHWDGRAGAYYRNSPVCWWEPNTSNSFDFENNWFVGVATPSTYMVNGAYRHMFGGSGNADYSVAFGTQSNYGTGEAANAELCELIFFNRSLSPDEQRSISLYLEWKYGLNFAPGAVPRIGWSIRNSAGTSTNSTIPYTAGLQIAKTGNILTIEGGDQWGTPEYRWANLEGTIFDGMIATSDINTENDASVAAEMNGVVFHCDRETKVYLVRQNTWNAISDINTWTRRSDLDGLWISGHTTNFFVYEKVFQAGIHSIDTNSAMYLFANPSDDAPAVEWTRDVQ